MPNEPRTHVSKKVVNMDHAGDRFVMCAWDECEKDGYELYKVRVNYGTPGAPHILSYVFCCERHRQYWIHNHRSYGNLPPGYRMSCI